MKAEKGREARKRIKSDHTMMIPVFCHFHTVLPVIYFMEWRQRKEVKRAREKRDHEDDVS